MWRRCSANDGRTPRLCVAARSAGLRTVPGTTTLTRPRFHHSTPTPNRQDLIRDLIRYQLLRTYPRRLGGYPFAPAGERSVARGYTKAVSQARHLIYIEDQYLWSPEVAATLAATLQSNPELHLVAVLPQFPDQDGRLSRPPNLVGRDRAIATLHEVAPGRVATYGLESPAGVPVYVHAKVCIIDDRWASVGSDNFNRRSWTHDSELTAAVYDPGYARALRLNLAGEHLDR
jgi:phosphatidylserine/phosphatidylglycerophosphate/cardiolipin synthase-like enzyme